MIYDADIFEAVEFGDLDSIQMYWSDEIDVNWQDLEGVNLLMLACFYGHLDIILFLLQFNPNLNLKNDKGKTAIEIAEEKGFKDIVKLLLK